MHLSGIVFAFSSLISLSTAHFRLVDPPPRGFSEDMLTRFPCGGQSMSKSRTSVSLTDLEMPIALEMGHDQTAVQVLLALGSHPGSNFNITLVPTFRQVGLGDFCLPSVSLDEQRLGVKPVDGMNATLQVVTNGDPNGGLYNCADITFSSTTEYTVPSSCKNGTGVTATPFSGEAATRNANESTPNGQPQRGNSGSGPTSNIAGHLETATWGVLGAIVVGGVALL
ncbi:expression library immunization antigen 1 [Coccidioides immitis RS]|uniref:Expression library immunization antigen 1 n=3 Tax=Coccidioides immitis TaxID=5501 RepID=A0A0E1RZY1_COCIM|nr:expression library immunization antigen 1 [Coccidioides immitis RS]EAS27427.1 expression library immunization antigen 1 [Coccidioides immitis RS]KMP09382.1 hypothetical protein CIRG_09552 [Coccidioides immitis RMSCC 2394]TPX20222.1 hypothetical protein DIZ76_016110 [Coccidioides immitis]